MPASKPGHSTHSHSCWWAFITSSSNKNCINKHPACLPSQSSNFSFFIFLTCYESHLHIFSETNSSISSTFLSYSYFRLIFWLLCYGNIGQNRLIIRNTKQWGSYKHVTCHKWWHTWSNLEKKTSLPPQNRHKKNCEISETFFGVWTIIVCLYLQYMTRKNFTRCGYKKNKPRNY